MATIAINEDCVAVTCGQRVLALRSKEPKLHILELPSPSKSGEEENESIASKKENAYVMGISYSRCNKWFAVCSSDKKLYLWDAHNWSLVSSRQLVRAADKVKFSPSGDNVLVADKSGDAYIFSVLDPFKEGLLLLGHLSMLLDVLICDNERYIISCDRDEKIRVSHFPNAYNIQSYCLGHTEFVSCLSFLPHHKDILVSGSGDGSVKFWNYVPGILINEISCQQLKANRSNSSKYTLMADTKSDSDNKTSTESNLGIDGEMTCAVMHVSCCIAGRSSLLGVSVAYFKGCLIYKVNGDSSKISYSISQEVHFQTEPWDLHLSYDGILWYSSCNDKGPLSAVNFDKNGKILTSEHSDKIIKILNLVNSNSKWFVHNTISERMCVLYKRKFDNVQEYQEKKKVRLSAI